MTLAELAAGMAGVLAVLLVRAVAVSMPRQRRGLARVEAKLDALMKHAGIEFDPYADLPPAVGEALRRGRKIEAIKEYRVLTGAGLKEAKEFVEHAERRAAMHPGSGSLH